MKKCKTPSKDRRIILLYACIFLFLLFWQWDGKMEYLNLSHDMGIRGMGEYVAISDDLAFGRDFFSIESAYSWLYEGNILFFTRRYREALFRLLVILVFPTALRTFCIVLFWNRARTPGARAIAAVASAGIFLSFPMSRVNIESNAGIRLYVVDICLIALHVLVYWTHTYLTQKEVAAGKGPKAILLYALLATSFLIALLPQIKFSNFPVVMALLVMMGIILGVRKKFVELGIFFGSFFLFSCGLWVATGEELRYFLPYISSQLHWATTGYSEVMSLPLSFAEGTMEDFIFAIFICIAYAATLVYFLRKDRVKAVSWFIIAPLMYMTVRYAFTRSDLVHSRTIMTQTVYIISFYILLIVQEVENQKPEGYYSDLFIKVNKRFWPAILLLLLLPVMAGRGWYPVTSIAEDFKALGSFSKYTAAKQANIDTLKANKICSTLYKNISAYPDKTIGMLCDGQMFIFAYDLLDRYEIIPYGALWENSSSESELMVADHYYSEDAPELVIHSYQTYNGRYMTTYMGTIFQALIENYHVDSVDENGYMILLRNDQQKHEMVALGEPRVISVGDVVEIPKVEDAYVFMKVDWDLTTLGNLAKTFLKPTKAFIEFTTDSGAVFKTNFFRTLSENGIYVSSLATSTQEWAEIINGNPGNRTVKSIKFEGDSFCYEQQIQISFYAVPYTQAQQGYVPAQ